MKTYAKSKKQIPVRADVLRPLSRELLRMVAGGGTHWTTPGDGSQDGASWGIVDPSAP